MSNSTTVLFSDKAKDYARYRPGYGHQPINTLLSPFEDYEIVKTVDVGAGTGIGSRLLAEKGCDVIGVEPNEKMIFSAEDHPNVTFKKSPAENIPLPDSYADLITCFQAFHWFNFKKSLNEFNRILKYNGQLAIIWSYWNREDSFTNDYVKLIEAAADKNKNRTEPYDGFMGTIKKLRVHCLWKLHYLPYFKNVTHHKFKHIQELDLEALIGCAKSQSYIQHQGPHWETLVEQIRELNHNTAATNLVYNIHLFRGTPIK